ncbi:MAG: lamin tail domain-containing protein, partial [Proteobacteria bacterium]|nr:lamin tail domain-containing protein [Pseudomonadota bacterium]
MVKKLRILFFQMAFIILSLLSLNATSYGAIVINEVDADTVGTDSAEFIELYDGGAGDTDLSGLTL